MKTERRQAREFALQALFHREANGGGDSGFNDFWSMFQRHHDDGVFLFGGDPDGEEEAGLPDKPREAVREFAETLVQGTIGAQDALDRLIEESAENWRIDRMSAVDRNILRLAVYESRYLAPPTPPVVVIDEAVELAKRYGTPESGRFVNGILDHIFREHLKRPADDESD